MDKDFKKPWDLKLRLDNVKLEIDGILYKAKAVPRFQRGDIASTTMILGLEKIVEKEAQDDK